MIIKSDKIFHRVPQTILISHVFYETNYVSLRIPDLRFDFRENSCLDIAKERPVNALNLDKV